MRQLRSGEEKKKNAQKRRKKKKTETAGRLKTKKSMTSFDSTNDNGNFPPHETDQVFKEILVDTKATKDFGSTQCLVANIRVFLILL